MWRHLAGTLNLTTPVDDVLSDREKTHGNFAVTAEIATLVREAMRCGPRWGTMTPRQRVSVEEIAFKLARIVCGDPLHPDHWIDIEGYARKAAP